MAIAEGRPTPTAARTAERFIDCDVHTALSSPEALRPYLPARWHADYLDTGKEWLSSFGKLIGRMYTASRPHNGPDRWDARPPSGAPAATDFAFMQQDYFETWPVDRAILAPLESNGWPRSGPFAAALMSALNDWLAAEWVDRDPRIFGAIAITTEEASLAALEIARMAAHPRFVQVEMASNTLDPMGHRRYWPIYEAAVRAGLPVSLHVGGGGSNPILANGWPSYHYEYHVGFAQAFQAQAVSLVSSGVFEAFPDLKVVLVEGGFAWIAPMIWRMDRMHRLWGTGGSGVGTRPSELFRKHVWFTTQPIDEPDSPVHFKEMLEQLDRLGMADNILFSTDYPHWDFDSPATTFPPIVPAGLRERIFRRNAESLFQFDRRARLPDAR